MVPEFAAMDMAVRQPHAPQRLAPGWSPRRVRRCLRKPFRVGRAAILRSSVTGWHQPVALNRQRRSSSRNRQGDGADSSC
jgi:hypothetical protein